MLGYRMRRWSVIFSFVVSTALPAADTHWSMTLNLAERTFEASESTNSVTVNGTLAFPTSGFIAHTVTQTSGKLAPAIGTVFYSISVPNQSLVVQPIQTTEQKMIFLEASGACPTQNFTSNFLFTQWDNVNTPKLANDYQPVFGVFDWIHSSNTGWIRAVYNLTETRAISNFTSFSLSGPCSNGQIDLSGGSGDRAGKIFMTSNGNAFCRTNAGKGIFMVPQIRIQDTSEITDSYAAFVMVAGKRGTIGSNGVNGGVDVAPYRFSFHGGNLSGTGTEINPNTGNATGAQVNLTINNLNRPTDGFFDGYIRRNKGTGKYGCAFYAHSRKVLFCSGVNPNNHDLPLNVLMVSDVSGFSRPISGTASAFNNTVYKVAPAVDPLNSGRVYAGGAFTTYNGKTNAGRYLVRLNPNGTPDWSFQTLYSDGSGSGTVLGFNAPVEAISPAVDTEHLGKVYVGGDFTRFYGTSSARFLVRLDADGKRDATFNTPKGSDPNVNSNVYSIVPPHRSDPHRAEGRIYVGGAFNRYGGTAYPHVLRLKADGDVDSTFSVGGTGPGVNSLVYALAPAEEASRIGNLYVGGDFSGWNADADHHGIVRLHSNGSLDSSFRVSAIDGAIYSIAPAQDATNEGKVYVAGAFTSIGGTTVAKIARLHTNGSVDTSFSPPGLGVSPSDSAIYSVFAYPSGTTHEGRIQIGGDFEEVSGTQTTGMARLEATGAVDSTFAKGTLYSGGAVRSIARTNDTTQADKFYVGGEFTSYKSKNRGRIHRIDDFGAED